MLINKITHYNARKNILKLYTRQLKDYMSGVSVEKMFAKRRHKTISEVELELFILLTS